MDLIADVLLGAGAIGAAVYCAVLSRRLRRLTQLEGGMGSAIAVLSAQVDELTAALAGAQSAAERSAQALDAQTARAESALARMDLVMAAMHDLPAPAAAAGQPPQTQPHAMRPPNPAQAVAPAVPRGAGPASPGPDRSGPSHPFGARVVPGPGAELRATYPASPTQDDDDDLRPRRARVVRRKPGWEAEE